MLLQLRNISGFALALLTLSFGGTVIHAYLSPADVFTDLEVPEATTEVEATTPVVEENVFGEPEPNFTNTEPEERLFNEPEPAIDPEPENDTPQSAPAFFRSGEKINQSTIPTVDTTSKDSPFEEVRRELLIPTLPAASDIDEESEAILEELEEELLEEELLGEDEPEEQLQQAARPKKKSVAMAILDRSKFLGGGVILAGIAFGFFFKKKKKPAAKEGSTNPEASAELIPAPEKIQQVEGRSQRLEHALEAMGQQPEVTEHGENASDHEPIGFSEVPIPGKEEKPE